MKNLRICDFFLRNLRPKIFEETKFGAIKANSKVKSEAMLPDQVLEYAISITSIRKLEPL